MAAVYYAKQVGGYAALAGRRAAVNPVFGKMAVVAGLGWFQWWASSFCGSAGVVPRRFPARKCTHICCDSTHI